MRQDLRGVKSKISKRLNAATSFQSQTLNYKPRSNKVYRIID